MPHLADAIVRRATAHYVGCFFPLHITLDAFFPLHITLDAFFRCTLRWMQCCVALVAHIFCMLRLSAKPIQKHTSKIMPLFLAVISRRL